MNGRVATGEAYSRLEVLIWFTQLQRICMHVYKQARCMVGGLLKKKKQRLFKIYM